MRAPDSDYRPNKWRLDRPERRVRRRWARWGLAAAVAASFTLAVAETVFDLPRHGSLMPDLLLVELPLFLAPNISPFARDTWLTGRGWMQYDEFERATLARASLVAHAAMFVGIAVLALAGAGALAMGLTLALTPRLLVLWAMAVLAIGFSLPALVAEWTVPMPDAMDQPL